MLLDQNLIFSSAQAVTSSAASTNVIDLEGGVAENIGVGTRFGADYGIGDGEAMPKVAAYVGTAFASGGASTLNIQFQGSTDSVTWTTYVETGAIAKALLTAGAKVAAIDWPHRMTGAALPRYVRLNYDVGTTDFTAGTIFAGIVLQRDDWPLGLYPAGYAVGT